STNPSVASVNDGVVFGLTEGETDIIVTTQDGGLSDTCHLTVFAFGIHDNEIPSFAVYPNPALSKITVSAYITGESVVEVIDMAGNVVYSIAMISEGTLELSIDMSDFGAGTYFVHLTNGKEQAIEKVIKK
ncbi:MAG: T9SS type A sorting domain-containing protein, partial [Ignavibacteria bacterium]|nr:T9SS type A sorting domain-containing protein [Ignavibacteria bacterium]